MCDHTVAYFRDFELQSTIVEEVIEECDSWNKHVAVISSITRKTMGEGLRNPSDYFDGRKGYMAMFKYCPDCGQKIDWAKIKKSLKEK